VGKMNYRFIIILLLIASIGFAQQINIIPELKKVEAGKMEEVKKKLIKLKLSNPGNPSVIFLEAVTTEDGEKSQVLYEAVYNNFPNSQFADAALFRSFSYYYALGLYKRAERLKELLRREYPDSPYLKNTDRSFPVTDEMLIMDSNPYKIKNAGKSRFTIQAGAFGQYENAENLKKKFEGNNLESKISPKRVNNVQFHIVTVGSFSSRSEAESFLNTLQSNYNLKGRIIKID